MAAFEAAMMVKSLPVRPNRTSLCSWSVYGVSCCAVDGMV